MIRFVSGISLCRENPMGLAPEKAGEYFDPLNKIQPLRLNGTG